ncbi:MAG: GNAT family N-acetyltransferase [Candidatus Thorarchaeota archaeon]
MPEFHEFMNDFTFATYSSRDKHDLESLQKGMVAITAGLGANIIEKTGITELGQSVGVIMKNNADEIVGGVFGNTFGCWLYISLLWVEKPLRNRGHGTELMSIIENEAVKMGCTNAHLDTYSFEARPFYERLGYEMFAALDDYPKGYSKYFLKKRLAT